MPAMEARFVWLFVLFDLPVGTKAQRRDANRFRNFLKDDGFMMLQFSVYARVCRGDDGATKHVARVTRNLPGQGSIRALQVTDRQYGRMRLLLGELTKTESVGSRQMVLL
jgi:CRISPR-associated protein Cas2